MLSWSNVVLVKCRFGQMIQSCIEIMLRSFFSSRGGGLNKDATIYIERKYRLLKVYYVPALHF
jgi:hypothetical protein